MNHFRSMPKQLIQQIVPHVTDAIQDWVERVSKIPVDDTGEEPDVCIIEVLYFVPRKQEVPLRHLHSLTSLEALLAILSQLLSLKLCASSSSELVKKILP
jgi:hypothetical protein